MKRSLTARLLAGFALGFVLAFSGCAAGRGGLPAFPKFSSLDYSSRLERLQAQSKDSPYQPAGGVEDAPSRGSFFTNRVQSRGFGRSGSC